MLSNVTSRYLSSSSCWVICFLARVFGVFEEPLAERFLGEVCEFGILLGLILRGWNVNEVDCVDDVDLKLGGSIRADL